eukprot:13272987-Alexandrium_andersonii.AAC.1
MILHVMCTGAVIHALIANVACPCIPDMALARPNHLPTVLVDKCDVLMEPQLCCAAVRLCPMWRAGAPACARATRGACA